MPNTYRGPGGSDAETDNLSVPQGRRIDTTF